MQLSGSLSQSVLHRNRSHDNQPIGGVRANPFSNECATHHVSNKIKPKPKKLIVPVEKLVNKVL